MDGLIRTLMKGDALALPIENKRRKVSKSNVNHISFLAILSDLKLVKKKKLLSSKFRFRRPS